MSRIDKAKLWLKYNGMNGTPKQVTKLIKQFKGDIGEQMLDRMLKERGLL